MKSVFAFTIIVLSFLFLATQYQNCGSTSGGSAFNNSGGTGNGEGSALDISFPSSTVTVASASQPFVVTGICSRGSFPKSRINWVILSGSSTLLSGQSLCDENTFNINGNLAGVVVPTGVTLNVEAKITGLSSTDAETPGPGVSAIFMITPPAVGTCNENGIDRTTLQNEIVAAARASGVVNGNDEVPGCASGNASIPSRVVQSLRVRSGGNMRWGLIRNISSNSILGDRVGYYHGTTTAEGEADCFLEFDFVISCGDSGSNTFNSAPIITPGNDPTNVNSRWTMVGYSP